MENNIQANLYETIKQTEVMLMLQWKSKTKRF